MFFLVSLGLISCLPDKKEKPARGIYANYAISGEEGKDFVTVFLQFSEGPEEFATVLESPAQVFLDDKLLTADSARESGAFYELQVPIEEFTGQHVIRYIDAAKTEHREEFSFLPLQLTEELEETISRQDLVLELGGVQPHDVLRIVMMDTSLAGDGVNELDTLENDQLDLRKVLRRPKNGPLFLQLFKEEDRDLSKGQRGKISITYGLKREFELKD